MLGAVTRCVAIVFSLACSLAACSGSSGPGGAEPGTCYETCLDSCGRESRDPGAPTCERECSTVCDGRSSPAATGAGDDGGVGAGADGGSTGAVFTITDP